MRCLLESNSLFLESSLISKDLSAFLYFTRFSCIGTRIKRLLLAFNFLIFDPNDEMIEIEFSFWCFFNSFISCSSSKILLIASLLILRLRLKLLIRVSFCFKKLILERLFLMVWLNSLIDSKSLVIFLIVFIFKS